MKTLDECRDILNELDPKIKDLFLKRMKTVKNVIEYKIANDLPIYDPIREKALKEKLLNDVDESLRPYYSELLDTILKVSKDYQEDIKKGLL